MLKYLGYSVLVFVVLWFLIFPSALKALIFWGFLGALLVAGIILFPRRNRDYKNFIKKFKTNKWLNVLWVAPLALSVITLLLQFWFFYRRGTPWAYYFFWHFIAWSILSLGVACVRWPKTIGKSVTYHFGDWLRRGGFVYFWSKDNLPANSLTVLWLILVVIAVLYGPPTPKVDFEQLRQEGTGAVSHLAHQASGVFNTILWGTHGNPFSTEAATATSAIQSVGLPKRYIRDWFWIKLIFFTLPFAFLGLIFSRRDEVAEILFGWVSKMRKEKESRAETSSASETTTEVAKKTASTAFSKLFASDILSDTLVTMATWLSGRLRRA
ncbi:MAG: hypothetical protein A2729_00335 [Candidatus Buchananbacteria bacterium RIFCSPHIGHO2_01_FULL_39_14]|uniref:Uncharacterized protein n=3 Tax=Parcubacteria group TaxID=1794811 RepID=A0A1F6XW96_9BACT|nr:MAG: hypothetical protein A3H53_02215 [Candidatus Nomurabacteria bacterium RIFCSPLOWO2_02_FULL_40_10]OGY45276.1 MAG: hypothetical protein A2729_00335 [Candidatus Buchananbacteria bacterium RIFCSPHIGHO2_01_FULL_39_14]OGY48751.1 MAG: hypothetical protein A3D39_04770 [Candidatus Buchananbacteria bacterium RIFCSPHIGHO2_02_FULL_39_17]OGY53523.1 MAG: hypothetical protein A2912_06080 [Candidatus Buchananbacteria bacterium RIFCSPLOWO2_01_FULL_40_23b]